MRGSSRGTGFNFAAGAARGLRAKDTKAEYACLKVITIAGFFGATMDQSGLRQLLAHIAQAQREAFIASQRHEGWILCACKLWRRRVLRRDHGSARSAMAARHGGSRIRDMIRGIVADLITDRAVLE
jgi:hypothetical protein